VIAVPDTLALLPSDIAQVRFTHLLATLAGVEARNIPVLHHQAAQRSDNT